MNFAYALGTHTHWHTYCHANTHFGHYVVTNAHMPTHETGHMLGLYILRPRCRRHYLWPVQADWQGVWGMPFALIRQALCKVSQPAGHCTTATTTSAPCGVLASPI